MYLANALEGEVQAWVEQGWHGVTQTTLELFIYWFRRDYEATEKFHPCQQRGIETIVYCHEIIQAKAIQEVVERIAPEAMHQRYLLPMDTISHKCGNIYCYQKACLRITGDWVLKH
jgi:hypothetical protein